MSGPETSGFARLSEVEEQLQEQAAQDQEQAAAVSEAYNDLALREEANAINEQYDEDSRQFIEKVESLNARAEIEIFGTKGRTEGYTDPSTGEPLQKPVKGIIETMRENPRYGKKQSERDAAAEKYAADVSSLVDEGFDLSQAKVVMDLRAENAEDVLAQQKEQRAHVREQNEANRQKTIEYELELAEYERGLDKLRDQYIVNGYSEEEAESLAVKRLKPFEPADIDTTPVNKAEIIDTHDDEALKEWVRSTGTYSLNGEENPQKPVAKDILTVPSTPDNDPVSASDRDTTPSPVDVSGEKKSEIFIDKDVTPERFKARLTVGEASKALKGEDSMINRRDLGLFGVFDGLGGHGNGATGSRTGAEGIEGYYETHTSPVTSVDEAIKRAKEAVLTARYNVDKSSEGGLTTAVFAKVEEIDGAPFLVWGNIGDSRLFIQPRNVNNAIVALSTDQSAGNTVFNVLQPGEENLNDHPDEFGARPLIAGDRIMLCSDGITGDWKDQFLSEHEMMQGFSPYDPQEAADKFIELSKKDDDKSVIVIDIQDEGPEALQPPLPSEFDDEPTPPWFENPLPSLGDHPPLSPWPDIPPAPKMPETDASMEETAEHPLAPENEVAARGLKKFFQKIKDSREARLTPIKPEQLVDDSESSMTITTGNIAKDVKQYLRENGFRNSKLNRERIWDQVEAAYKSTASEYDEDAGTLKFDVPEKVRKQLTKRRF